MSIFGRRLWTWVGAKPAAGALGTGCLASCWLRPGNRMKLFHHPSQSFGSLVPDLDVPSSLGVTRISLFQEVLDEYLNPRQQWPSSWNWFLIVRRAFLHVASWASQQDSKDACTSFCPRNSLIQGWFLSLAIQYFVSREGCSGPLHTSFLHMLSPHSLRALVYLEHFEAGRRWRTESAIE